MIHKLCNFIAVLLLVSCSLVYGQALDRQHLVMYSPLDYGSGCVNSTLTLLITAWTTAGSPNATLLLTGTNRSRVACTWALTADLVIPEKLQLYVPFGAKFDLSGHVLTLQSCPKIDGFGWLKATGGGSVKVTAANCPIAPEIYSTSGDGTLATPWLGWEAVFNVTAGLSFQFACGYYQTSQSIIIKDTFNGYVGPFTFEGCNSGGPSTAGTIILFTPVSGTATSHISAITGNPTVRTLFDIGKIGSETENVIIRRITIRSSDTAFAKQGWHILDARNLVFEHNTMDGWYDTTGNSVAFHIEGRGQNHIIHNTFYTNSYPMIIDGTPNEGGVCYSTDTGWTGTAGICEFDTNEVANNSFAVSRYTAGPIGQTSFAHANVLIGPPTAFTRNQVHRNDCNGGSSCVYWHGTSAVSSRNNHFSTWSWEDEQPLDPTQVGAARITARVAPSVMFTDNRYSDNTYLQINTNWGYIFDFDFSGSTGGAINFTFENIEQEAGGNGFNLHGVQGVTIDHYIYSGNGFNSKTYPGECNMAVNPCVDAFPPASNHRALVLNIAGTVAANTASYPVTCTNCFAGSYNQISATGDLQVTEQGAGPDPIMYISAAKTNVFVSAARVVWDSTIFIPVGQVLGTFTWTPKLMDGHNNQATYTSHSGVMSIWQSGAGSVITSGRWLSFSAYIVVAATTGMTATDELHIEATAGDPFSKTYCPTANCPGMGTGLLPYYHTLATLVNGATLPANYTSVTAVMPGNDQVVLFYDTAATSQTFHRMQVSEIAAGTIIAVNGSVPLQ